MSTTLPPKFALKNMFRRVLFTHKQNRLMLLGLDRIGFQVNHELVFCQILFLCTTTELFVCPHGSNLVSNVTLGDHLPEG